MSETARSPQPARQQPPAGSVQLQLIITIRNSRSAQLLRIVPQFWQINLHLISFTFVEPQMSHTSGFTLGPQDLKSNYVATRFPLIAPSCALQTS